MEEQYESNLENRLTEAELKKQRNVANNANNIRNLADIASNTQNPYAKAAGTVVKAADKITGGKSSEALGKALNTANKFTPGGRIAQKAMNKMSESGTSSRISSAINKKNSSAPANVGKGNVKSNAVAEGKNDSSLSRREVEDQTSDGAEVNLKATANVIKIGLAALAPVIMVVVFMCLIVAASQTYLGVIGLDQADKVSSSGADTQIRENGSEGLDQEITDENVNEGLVSYNDIFIDDYSKKCFTKKIFISNERPYSEAELNELSDFYSGINNYEGHNMDTVYKFFFKLLYIQRHYKKSYNVDLDMPLIMATLNIKTDDKNQVFIDNTVDYKVTSKENNTDFDYYKDWSKTGYISTKTNSAHDIEILAQNMVSKTSDSGCYNTVDRACYKIDDEKYREFLSEFIEKKYFTEEGYKPSSLNNVWNNSGVCPTETPFNKYVLTDEQLILLTSRAMAEQGTPKGAAAEASLMANLFELQGSKYGVGGEGLYNYVVYGGWFGSSERVLATNKALATEEAIKAVKSVLVEGKRTLPKYIDEHDCINCTKNGDISSITLDGKNVSKLDKLNYVQHKTIINNIYGATYTFYSFPTESSDPFGYKSKTNKEEMGDFYYDYDTGQPVNCSINPGKDGNYTGSIIYSDSEFVNIIYYNQGDYKKNYYSSDPLKKVEYYNGGKNPATISSHGCGPTSLSIVLSSLLNREIDPIESTSKVCLKGGCTNSGSKYKTLATVAKEYGINVVETSNNQEVINALASKNSLVIVLMGPGTFTTGGHYIVLTGVDSNGNVSVADPGSRKRTEKKWYSFNTIVEQRKTYAGYLIFSR